MDFDKSRVYTAVNAEDLHEGDLCVFADTLGVLKERVYNDIGVGKLFDIREEDEVMRFVSEDDDWGKICYGLAYLVCPARNVEAYKAWKEGEAVEVTPYNPRHTYTRIENDGEEPDWTQGYYRPVEEKPKEKKYRSFKDCKELCDFWYTKTAVNVPSYAMPLIWVSYKATNDIETCKDLITGFCGNLIHITGDVVTLQELFEKYTFLDGTPCGVEE